MDKMYASQMAKSDCASHICANWLGDNHTIDLHAACRPGQVQYYIKYNVVLKRSSEEIPMSFLLAFTEWYKQHPEKNELPSISSHLVVCQLCLYQRRFIFIFF